MTQLLRQLPREGCEGAGAHMMLNPLGIDLGGFLGNPQGTEEINHHLVTMLTLLGEFSADRSQENRPIGLGRDIPLALQAGQGVVHRHMGDAEPPGQVHDPGLTLRGGQIGDRLHVILRRLPGMLAPRLTQALGLEGGGAYRRRRRAGGFFNGHAGKMDGSRLTCPAHNVANAT